MFVAANSAFEPEWASPGDWAAMYRAAGLQVVPSHLPSEHQNWKRPALADWKALQEEIVPAATFDRWYGAQGEHARRPNMGLISGHASANIFVIDLDEYKDAQALEWWRAVLTEHNSGLEPETWQQVTGGGGRQLFFKAPASWRAPTNKTPIGVDIRGQGGFAVLPPSQHISGNTYKWKDGFAPWECEIEDAPAWLLEAVATLVERFGGDQHRDATAPEKTHTASPAEDFDAFGARVDGRDHYMRDLVWAAVIEWHQECPIPPSETESQARMREVYMTYERKVKSRLGGDETNSAKLEREGRGASMFADKWRRAMGKWSTDIAEAAAKSPLPPAVVTLEATPPGDRFLFEKVSDLRRYPPAQWLVRDWIPEGSTGIFYGKWAAGKSFIGFDLALHMSYGMADWHGAQLPGTSQHVLVLAREGHQSFVNRVDAFKRHHGLPDDNEHLTFMRGSVSFMNDQDFGALCAAIKATGIAFRLVIVDTVARVLPGVDMNEQQTVTTFMERIAVLGQLTGAATIGVHHQNKTGGMMGSTFFEANSDFVFEVEREGEGALERGTITCTKQKDSEDGWKRAVIYSKIALSVLPDGPSSLVVKSIDSERPERKEPFWPDRTMCTRVINCIREAWDSGQPLSPAVNTRASGRYAPAVISNHFEIKAAVAEAMVKQWLDVRPQVLAVEMFDKNSKARGLKVVGSID